VYVTVQLVVDATAAVPIVGAAGTLAATAEVAAEFAETELVELVAVTTQRRVCPTYVVATTYVLEVAPEMFVFETPNCH
jgi:hypothetical protein